MQGNITNEISAWYLPGGSATAATQCGRRAVSNTRRRTGDGRAGRSDHGPADRWHPARPGAVEGVMTAVSDIEKPKVSLLYNPKVRNVAYQLLLCGVIAVLVYGAVANAIENLRRAKIASGFGFWNYPAGFDISESLIDYSSTSTYARAFWVALSNTLLLPVLPILFATTLVFVFAIAPL